MSVICNVPVDTETFISPRKSNICVLNEKLANTENCEEILNLLRLAISKIINFRTQCLTRESELNKLLKQLKYLENKCISLEKTVELLNKKECGECPKLENQLKYYKKRTCDTETKLISTKAKLASITNIINAKTQNTNLPILDIDDNIINSLNEEIDLEQKDENITPLKEQSIIFSENNSLLKTPESKKSESENKKSDLNVSPIVHNRHRNPKRKIVCISSKKKSKIDNCNLIPNSQNIFETGKFSELTHLTIIDVEDKQKTDDKSPQKNIETPRSGKGLKHQLSPLPINIVNNNTPLSTKKISNIVESPNNDTKNKTEKSKTNIIWNLKKSRELVPNRKLKQTILSTALPSKKTDISTINKSNNKIILSPKDNLNKNDEKIIFEGVPDKENSPDSAFEPIVTSTSIDNEQEKIKQKSPLKTPVKNQDENIVINDSYDYIPSSSPRYKYRRDPIRKRSELLKLPGQDCAKCAAYYANKKTEFSESQLKAFMNKCSRHRDKYAIRMNTPPGFWNPKIEDTNDSD